MLVNLLIFFLYFTYAAIFGNNGLKKNIDLEFQIMELNNNLISLEKVMHDIETKTSKLNKNNLDLDLLDQQSRIVLGLIRTDEIMIIEK
ncbi:MAG: septum formation initiator family protein [Paracoccaceae bacterium]|tara:strand:- start:21 stop:287 length:267 start_codon:yes stop_codon:yes gene_type:complete